MHGGIDVSGAKSVQCDRERAAADPIAAVRFPFDENLEAAGGLVIAGGSEFGVPARVGELGKHSSAEDPANRERNLRTPNWVCIVIEYLDRDVVRHASYLSLVAAL